MSALCRDNSILKGLELHKAIARTQHCFQDCCHKQQGLSVERGPGKWEYRLFIEQITQYTSEVLCPY
jgi:hypothetical protein